MRRIIRSRQVPFIQNDQLITKLAALLIFSSRSLFCLARKVRCCCCRSNISSFFAITGFVLAVYADGQTGFISIDCGLSNGSAYTDPVNGLNYVSDAAFIDTGIRRYILPEYQKDYTDYQYALSLRSFPEGNRNCYKITRITKGITYLIRATFYYGDYDELHTPPAFDLYLGTDLWDSVVSNLAREVDREIIHIPPKNHVHVCLADTGKGTPFISSLEFRPLDNTSYPAEIGHSLLLQIQRYDAGSDQFYRYDDDIHDRFWFAYEPDDWTSLNTSDAVNVSGSNLDLPSVVMETAATPKSMDYLDISWPIPADHPDNSSAYYVYLHFAEVKKLRSNESRQFNIFPDGVFFNGPYTPLYLQATTLYSQTPLIGGTNSIKLSKAANSTLPPIINAWEVYSVKQFPQSETDQQDVDAMTSIKSTYGMKRNWQGDPCLPKLYLWEGLECSYPTNNQLPAPRVISLDLSSSGLIGEVSHYISNLTMIQTLDLSNNNLTGSIPDFLSELQNLKVINLENNNLTGSIPVELVQKQKDGVLSLSACGNPKLSSAVPCKKKSKKNFVLPITASIVGAFILVLLTVVAIWWTLTRKRRTKLTIQNGPLDTRKRQFVYSEIVSMTNNFERILGAGGFGKVFYGDVNNTQVAVKMLSASSIQGYHQFQAEVLVLMRVHHKNLTSLVGYCNDENNVALIYEYMANGNLRQHLSGSKPNILKWEDRLLIAIDTAQGLEYLHYGCKPPIIHRDVKSTNILLNENFQAKLSDFGLSKIISNYDESTHVSTKVAGTPGYLDPEYYMSNRLKDKSDVFSFGVVLLEIITGRPVLSKSSEQTHIIQWVRAMLDKGDIGSIVDPRLEGNFNINSAWKIIEIAMKCVVEKSTERPTMSQVVGDLKESLEMGLNQKSVRFDNSGGSRDTAELMSSMSIATCVISAPSAR